MLQESGFLQRHIFKHLKVNLKDFFCLSSYRAKHRRLTYEDIAAEMLRETRSKLGSHILVDYVNYLRIVCTGHFLRNPSKIEGLGKVVKIDGTLFIRRKYNSGKAIEKQWCFGGVERETNKCFVVPVERREAATLLPLIRQYVVPGTSVMSDQWAAYSTIKDTPKRYQHEAVNYSLHFINPETGAYTNSIESLWQKFEEGHKSRYGTESALLNLYMDKIRTEKSL